ncbi:class I SAM-dependent methyltransferase [Thiomonas sp.]
MKTCVKCSSKQCEGAGWKCLVCGYMPPQKDGFVILAPNMVEMNDGYHVALFSECAAIETHHFWFVVRRKIIMDFLKSEFPYSTSMLEIGCGNGFILSDIQKNFPGLTLCGSEASLEGLHHASTLSVEANLIQMDARSIPFEEEFDIIGAFDVLEHIDLDERVLQQMYCACKPGGGIFLTVPQHQWLWSSTDEYAGHKRRYSRAELVRKVEAAGFRVHRVTSFVFLLLPLMVISRLLQRNSKKSKNPVDEGFRIGKFTNRILQVLLEIERWPIRMGVSLPMGGSLLLVARKP